VNAKNSTGSSGFSSSSSFTTQPALTQTIMASSGSNGTISPTGSISVATGANQRFTISPNTGYHVDSVAVNGIRVDSTTSYTFSNVTANYTIRAVFAINQYTIDASAGSGGTISPGGMVVVNYGSAQTFTINPDSGYELGPLHVDGALVAPTPVYQFTNVLSSHTIQAAFRSLSVVQTISMIEGWNTISVPLTVVNARAPILFPTASSAAYGFDPVQGYVTYDTLQNGVGYWLKFPSAQNDSITGVMRNQDSLTVHPGWNLIGSISTPVVVDSIIQIPPGIVLSNYYRYSGTYSSTDTLQPGNAYWVKVGQSGRLVLH
jgi:hypothetical protein